MICTLAHFVDFTSFSESEVWYLLFNQYRSHGDMHALTSESWLRCSRACWVTSHTKETRKQNAEYAKITGKDTVARTVHHIIRFLSEKQKNTGA